MTRTACPENPHGVRSGPFLQSTRQLRDESIDSLIASEFFSVVRNPYSRFLSGYLNKVGRNPWRKMSARFGMSPDSRPTIEEFLAAMKGIDRSALDRHFRPQHMNLLHGFVPLDFVGYLEDVDAVRAFLGGHGFVMQTNTRNATDATRRIPEMLQARAIAAIQEIYEQDFEIFGYSADPAQLESIRPIRSIPGDRSALPQVLVRRIEAARRGAAIELRERT